MSNTKVTKILIVHLRSNFKGQPFVDSEVHNVALEDELSYTLALGLTTNLSTPQVIKKTETNEVRYVQVYSNVDSKTYWHFDVYCYAEINDAQILEEMQSYWIDECQIRAMEELKQQNQMIKAMYKGIELLKA